MTADGVIGPCTQLAHTRVAMGCNLDIAIVTALDPPTAVNGAMGMREISDHAMLLHVQVIFYLFYTVTQIDRTSSPPLGLKFLRDFPSFF